AATIDNMRIHLFDGTNGAPVRTIESSFYKYIDGAFGNDAALLQVAWSPNTPIIASAGFDGMLRVLDLRRGAAPKSVMAGPAVQRDGDDNNNNNNNNKENFLGW